jgi:AcrR family transcriptional regulator
MADGKDAKSAIVDAMMGLAATRRFEDIAIRDIAAAAGVSLADFRDAFPSKGAVLAAFSRRIDRAVLSVPLGDLASSPARDRLFDVLMRRLDAMAPYRAALREISGWIRRDPSALMELNRLTVNSMRFMMEAAEIDSDGPSGALKLQGLALAWARVFAVWLEDAPPDFSKTMAALDRELTRGERIVAGVDRLERIAAPLRSLAEAGLRRRREALTTPALTDETAPTQGLA